MTRRINDIADTLQALAVSNWAVGEVAGTLVNATGYGRARFIFNIGPNTATTAAFSAGGGPYKAATSGATFTRVTSLAAVTSGVLGGNVMIVDVPVDPAKPWLKISGHSVLSTAIQFGAVVELYCGMNRPPTTTTPQQVVVA